MGHVRIAVLALCGALLVVGGCGGGDGDDDGNSAATPTATASPAEPGATAEPGGTEEPAGGEAVATQTVEARESGETTLDIEVMGLQVSGELATLSLRYTAHDPEPDEDAVHRLVDLHGGRRLFVTLVDPVNLKRYHVVEDTSGESLSALDLNVDVPVEDSVTADYTFAAPPADVDTIDVSVGDWPPFRDVPIER
jgi:hypothetical protein